MHFRLHRMQKIQTIVTDDRGVCQSVCHAAQLGSLALLYKNG